MLCSGVVKTPHCALIWLPTRTLLLFAQLNFDFDDDCGLRGSKGRCLTTKILQGAFWAFADIRVCEFNAFTLYSAASRQAVHSVKCNTDWGKHVIEHTAVCPQLQSTLTFQSNTNRVSDDMRTMNETFLHSCHFTFTDVGIVLGKMRRVIKQTVTNSKLSGVREIQRNAHEYMKHFKLFYLIVPLLQDFHIILYYTVMYFHCINTECTLRYCK